MIPRSFFCFSQRAVLSKTVRILCVTVLSLFTLGCGAKAKAPTGYIKVASGGIYAGALNNQGDHAVIGSLHHGVSYWRLSDGERLFDWSHKEAADTTLKAADISPEGNWALTADINTLVLWNTKSGESIRYWQAPGEISSVQLSRDGDTALLGLNNHTAVLFDIRRGGILHTFNHNNRVHSVSLDDEGTVAATGSEDYTAVTWDLREDKSLAKKRHNDEVQLVALSPDGTLVLSVSRYDKAVIWRAHDGEVVGEIPLRAGRIKRGLRFTSARFSADNKFLLTGQTDQTVSLWRLNNLKRPTSWKVGQRRLWKPSGASIIDVAFTSKDGVFYAIASNGLIFRLTL